MSDQHKEDKALQDFRHQAIIALIKSNIINNWNTINGIADMLEIAIDSRDCKFGTNRFDENLKETNKQLKDFIDRRKRIKSEKGESVDSNTLSDKDGREILVRVGKNYRRILLTSIMGDE